MKIAVKLFLLAGLIVLGVWLWQGLFPGPKKIIEKRLAGLAEAASFGPKEGPLTTAGNVSKLVNYFSRDAVVTFDNPGEGSTSLNGREEIQQTALAARSLATSLSVQFIDVKVKVADDEQSATVNLTVKARIRGEPDLHIQELKFFLKKIEGEWLIMRIESVKVLSHASPALFLLEPAA